MTGDSNRENPKPKFQMTNTGFTLMELLVSMAVFAVIVTVASGIFIRSIQNERRLVTTMSMQGNLDTALEQMAREIRGGYLFNNLTTGAPCGVSGNPGLLGSGSVTFVGPEGTTTYGLSSGSIERDGVPITSSDTNVKNLCFLIGQAGADYPSDSCNPWRVTIVLNVAPSSGTEGIYGPQPFYLQTTVSSRVLPKDMPIDVKYQYGYSCK